MCFEVLCKSEHQLEESRKCSSARKCMSATNNVNTLACTVYNVYNVHDVPVQLHLQLYIYAQWSCLHGKEKIPVIVNFAKLISKYPLNGGGGSSFTLFCFSVANQQAPSWKLMVCDPLKKEAETDWKWRLEKRFHQQRSNLNLIMIGVVESYS